MDPFRTQLAPLSAEAWALLRDDATATLATSLSARKLVDVRGPLGWRFSAVSLGRVVVENEQVDGVAVGVRAVLPMVELRAPFVLDLWALDDVARGATDIPLEPMLDAARQIARAEDHVVLRGLPSANMRGLLDSLGEPIAIPSDLRSFPGAVAAALVRLNNAGVAGPYVLALGDQLFEGVNLVAPEDYPLQQRLARLVGQPVQLAPGLGRDAVLISRRGGDFELTLGADLTIGYEVHDAKQVRLYFTESIAYRTLEHTAGVRLTSTSA